ncbi:gamma-glutamylcyclotransferase family protein [Candidatus Riflebacteria bacterium]
MKYFAYGSNMCLQRLRERVRSAKKVTTACLKGHLLKFHKISIDGSGKCDIHETGYDSDLVYGVVYEVDECEKSGLDRAESLGYGYELKTVEVMADARRIKAFTYYATAIDESLKPYKWYKAYVVCGAKENGFPHAYIAMLEGSPDLEDPDKSRRELNTLSTPPI